MIGSSNVPSLRRLLSILFLQKKLLHNNEADADTKTAGMW